MDRYFISEIIVPLFTDDVNFQIILYVNEHHTSMTGRIKSAYSLVDTTNTTIFYLRDSDFNNNKKRTIAEIKSDITTKYSQLNEEDIIIVIIEIESWYYAGLSPQDCLNLDIPILPNGTIPDKEMIQSMALEKKLTPREILLEMLDYYNIDQARSNSSFNYFIDLLETKLTSYLL